MRQKKLETIRVLDDAVDTTRGTSEEMIAYFKTRDIEKIKPFIKPGEIAEVYHLREIPLALVLDGSVDPYEKNEMRLYSACFRAAVVRVENLRTENGGTIDFTPENLGPTSMIAMQTLLQRFDFERIEEIGRLAADHSFLAKKTGDIYQVPPMCLERLAKSPFRPVDASPSSPVPNNSKASSPEASAPEASPEIPSVSATSADASANPTVVIAAESSAGGVSTQA